MNDGNAADERAPFEVELNLTSNELDLLSAQGYLLHTDRPALIERIVRGHIARTLQGIAPEPQTPASPEERESPFLRSTNRGAS